MAFSGPLSSYPLATYFSYPAVMTGPCLVELCGDFSGPVSCQPILAQCQAGSTSFTTNSTGSQSFPCAYDYGNGTSSSTNSIAVSCGLVSLNATIVPSGGNNFIFSSNGGTSNNNNLYTVPTTTSGVAAPQWPASYLDLSGLINDVSVYIAQGTKPASATNTPATTISGTATPTATATPSASAKSGGIKGISLSKFVSAGVLVSLVFSTML